MIQHRVDVSASQRSVEPLSSLPDCQLAEGTPDIRGWDVTSPTSAHLGTVKDLLVDLSSLRVRYLDVELDPLSSLARHTLLPIGKVWINEALDEVVVPASPSLETLPTYDPDRFDRQFEHRLLAAFGDAATADFYASSAFDARAARAGGVEQVTCARRATDPDNVLCPVEETAMSGTEAANGIELSVVTEGADHPKHD